MRMYKLNRQSGHSFVLLLLLFAYTFTSSCVGPRRIYFNDLETDSANTSVARPIAGTMTPFVDPKIETNDVLAISIQTMAQSASSTPITTGFSGSFNELNGNLVDKNGYIELTLIGFVKVAGLTTTEAREVIKQKAKEFWNSPVVNVRIANFDIAVLGDVSKPGTITSASEKIRIIDAIALSGDLSLTARHDNVLLVRTEGDTKKYVRFDLTKSSIYSSPYFYLKQRDLIYVEPSRTKIESNNNALNLYFGYFSVLISLASFLVAFKVIK